jgi:hypothetical protein
MTETIKCPCGRGWRLIGQRLISPDKDSIHCICGALLKQWNGANTWVETLVEGLPEDESSG